MGPVLRQAPGPAASGGLTAVADGKAAVAGLQGLRKPSDVAARRGRDVNDVAPKPMLEAIAAAEERTNAARAAALQEQYGIAEPEERR